MSKVTDGFGQSELLDLIDVNFGGHYYRIAKGLLDHARALEEAMTILIDIVKTEKPRLDLSNFTKLLE